MRAIVRFGPGADAIGMVRQPLPTVAAGQMRVRMQKAAVSFADLLIARDAYQDRAEYPFVLGSEGVGVVDEVGGGVGADWLGKKVMIYGFRPGPVGRRAVIGTWSDHTIVTPDDAVEQPVDMDDVIASLFRTSYETAAYALKTADLRPGEHLLVLGAAGAVGVAAIELGRVWGAHVIASAGTAAKRSTCFGRGAHVVLDSTAADWSEQVGRAAGGRGIDIVFDPVGGRLAESAARRLAMRGRHIVVGFASGAAPTLSAGLLLMKNATVIGVNQIAFRDACPQASRDGIAALLELYKSGALRLAPVGAVIGLEEFAARFAGGAGLSPAEKRLVIDLTA